MFTRPVTTKILKIPINGAKMKYWLQIYYPLWFGFFDLKAFVETTIVIIDDLLLSLGLLVPLPGLWAWALRDRVANIFCPRHFCRILRWGRGDPLPPCMYFLRQSLLFFFFSPILISTSTMVPPKEVHIRE